MNEHPMTRSGRTLTRLLTPFTRAGFLCAATVMALMSIPVFIDVVLRHALRGSLEGAYELEEIALALVSFLALAQIQTDKDHISITFITDRLSNRIQSALNVLTRCAGAPLMAVLAWRMFMAALAKQAVGEVSFELELPIWPIMMICALGLILFALQLLADTLEAAGKCLQEGHGTDALIAVLAAALVLAIPALFRVVNFVPNLSALGASAMLLMMILLFLGMPIGISMALVGALGLLILYPSPLSALSMMGQATYSKGSEYSLTVIPLFILMGELAYHSGISKDLFRAASTWLGRLPGGLAIAGIAGCAGFAAVCGDSMATAVTMGSVALPEMRQKAYDPGLSCASLAAGGTLGILIPPSMGFIFYAIVTEESIGRLFLAGVVPGLLLAALFILYTAVLAMRRPHLAPRGDAFPLREKLKALRGVVVMLMLIVLILGGILGGFFSPNEGAAVGATGTLLYAVATRRLSWKDFKASLFSAVRISAKLMLILISVGLLGYFFAATQLPQKLAEWVGSLNTNRYIIFAGIVVLYIILGCMMNVIPMILLTLPALFPTVQALKFDPVWFGVCTVLLMEMGQITPPVGVNVFAMSSVARDIPMSDIFHRITPYFMCMVTLLVLLTIFPSLALWLPSIFF